jgi:hypothetical protein
VNVEDAPLGVVNGIGTRSFLPPMEFSVVPGAMTAGYGKEYVEYGYGLTRAPERRTRGRVNHHGELLPGHSIAWRHPRFYILGAFCVESLVRERATGKLLL